MLRGGCRGEEDEDENADDVASDEVMRRRVKRVR